VDNPVEIPASNLMVKITNSGDLAAGIQGRKKAGEKVLKKKFMSEKKAEDRSQLFQET
jgi:hypothetical protein